jgi:predicted nucleotidyltransferase
MNFTHNGTVYELLFLTLAGSKLYGNSRPESDTDYRGVFLAPNSSKLGLLGTVEQLEGITVTESLIDAGLELEMTEDTVIYELNRFCKLALDNNPNIMDMLCHDYTNADFAIYNNEKGRTVLSNKDLFMSTKLKHTFSGYAMAQLKRIKGHNKWINEYPDTDEVLRVLTDYFTNLEVLDFEWLVENFGGQVAEKVTDMSSQEAQKLPKDKTKTKMTWDEFLLSVDSSLFDWNKYRIPRLIDYMNAYDLTHSKLDMKVKAVLNGGRGQLVEYKDNKHMGVTRLDDFLMTKASFRKFGESVLVCYMGGTGLFGREGNLKANDSEYIENYVCVVSVNHNDYKKDKDHVNKMWNWKCNRNEKRGALEEKFGYDTKHASHLVRLMATCKDLLTTGDYNPTLTGDRLKLVNDTRDGKFTYDELLKFATERDNELEEMYKTSTLQKKPNHKKVNEIVLKLHE